LPFLSIEEVMGVWICWWK